MDDDVTMAIDEARDEAAADIAQSPALAEQKALRVLGGVIGTDADIDEYAWVATYAEAVLAHFERMPSHRGLAPLAFCPECMTTALKSDSGKGCRNCGY
jgi:hypothetical protein